MGIFSKTPGICDRCGRMTLWDGPYSDCGCYRPPITVDSKIYKLDKKVIEDTKRLVRKIENELHKDRE